MYTRSSTVWVQQTVAIFLERNIDQHLSRNIEMLSRIAYSKFEPNPDPNKHRTVAEDGLHHTSPTQPFGTFKRTEGREDNSAICLLHNESAAAVGFLISHDVSVRVDMGREYNVQNGRVAAMERFRIITPSYEQWKDVA